MPGPERDFAGYGRERPRVTWPGGAAVAINLVVVYEEGAEASIADGDERSDGWGEYATAAPAGIRDLGTETHYEYGSRAGIWRLARLADSYGIPVTVAAAAVALERNPEVWAWADERGHDLLGHGWRWTELSTLGREEEQEHLRRALETYLRVTGERPLGWNSRSFPSVHTRSLIAAEGGFLYYSDPCNDDLPYFVDEGGRRLLVVPYSKTTNDSRYVVSPGYGGPADFLDTCRRALDFLCDEAEDHGGAMMTVAVHARWSGQPARAAAVRDFVEHALGRPEARFFRRLDIARFWIERHSPQAAPRSPSP